MTETLWSSTDLHTLYLPSTQPFPFYYKTDKLRLFYQVNPDFWEWLRRSVAAALRSSPVPPEEMAKVVEIEKYVSHNFPNIPGLPQLPPAESAADYERRLTFADSEAKYLKTKEWVMWRPR